MVPSTHAERVAAARKFVAAWTGRGNEKQDTQSFWIELCDKVLGMPDVSTNVLFENKTSSNGYIDVRIDDAKTFVEQKSSGINLDKAEIRQGVPVTPFQQCKRYADDQPNSKRPDTIIICNFDTFRIHDLNKEKPADNYIEFKLSELPEQIHLLNFLTDPHAERMRREERVSLQAGSLIAKIYDQLQGQYANPDSAESQHSLNVLCVRLVFCLFAEDEGLFEKNAFAQYIRDTATRDLRRALQKLFEILDTPIDKRDPYDQEEFKDFPYVNGGLFRDMSVEIPPFTDEIKQTLVDEVAMKTDWSQISPTIFGGVFESTLNPETRHAGGMHYTSAKNIHRVIDSLFLDELTAELNEIIDDKKLVGKRRIKALEKYHTKIASLKFFDPACGSGNFLTETYLCLRKLEKTIIYHLSGGQTAMSFGDESFTQLKVSLDQFYGIEINDFACAVATTALYIAKLQADTDIESLYEGLTKPLPLTDTAKIVHGNALTTDWNTILSAELCNYVIGNPPFVGQYSRSDQQTNEMKAVWTGGGTTYNGYLDYVTSWFKLACDYLSHPHNEFAFVATNSITQGSQVAPLFTPIFNSGWIIKFAHRTFAWTSDSLGQAAVHCVIIGFTKDQSVQQKIFDYEDYLAEPKELQVITDITGYLTDGEHVSVPNSQKPISPYVPPVNKGSQPTDGGWLIVIDPEVAEAELKKLHKKLQRGKALSEKEQVKLTKYETSLGLWNDPIAKKYIRKFIGAEELLKNKPRWCLWLTDATAADIRQSKPLKDRLARVAAFREASPKAPTRAQAQQPHLFTEIRVPKNRYLCIPSTVSENRTYMLADYLDADVCCSNSAFFGDDPDGYLFAIFTSSMFYTWQQTIGGRLESRVRFANKVTWNTFPLPELNTSQKAKIIAGGQAVLKARAKLVGQTLVDMYDPLMMDPNLRKAHDILDKAVDSAFGLKNNPSEGERLSVLFDHYQKLQNK